MLIDTICKGNLLNACLGHTILARNMITAVENFQVIEFGACMERQPKSSEVEDEDAEFADISFEELLAQEKKDAFWQRIGNGEIETMLWLIAGVFFTWHICTAYLLLGKYGLFINKFYSKRTVHVKHG